MLGSSEFVQDLLVEADGEMKQALQKARVGVAALAEQVLALCRDR